MYNFEQFMEWHEYLETIESFAREDKAVILEADKQLEEFDEV